MNTSTDYFENTNWWLWLFEGEARGAYLGKPPSVRAQLVAATLRLTGADFVVLTSHIVTDGLYGCTWKAYDGQLVVGKLPHKTMFGADFVLKVGSPFVVLKSRDPQYLGSFSPVDPKLVAAYVSFTP